MCLLFYNIHGASNLAIFTMCILFYGIHSVPTMILLVGEFHNVFIVS